MKLHNYLGHLIHLVIIFSALLTGTVEGTKIISEAMNVTKHARRVQSIHRHHLVDLKRIKRMTIGDFVECYDPTSVGKLKNEIKDIEKRFRFPINAPMSSQGFGIEEKYQDEWEHLSTLLKIGILAGDRTCSQQYQFLLQIISYGLQIAYVENSDLSQELKQRKSEFCWSLLALEDPVSRKFLAKNYRVGRLIQKNEAAAKAWEKKYKSILPLPELTRIKLLKGTPYYPFKDPKFIPQTDEDWQGYFPTLNYKDDLNDNNRVLSHTIWDLRYGIWDPKHGNWHLK